MSTSAELFAKDFLRKVRDFIELEGLKSCRLPGWVKSANVKIATLNNSTIFLFDDSNNENDSFVDCGKVWSDLQFFLGLLEYIPQSASLRAPDKHKIVILIGEYGRDAKVVLNIVSFDSALFNVGYVPYHSPIAIVNIFIQLSPLGEVSAIRFVPFAIYVHDKDLADFEVFWDKCTPHIQDLLKGTHSSNTGDYYQAVKERTNAILMNKERSVIVFGKYGDNESLGELVQIRDYLKKSYEAYLLSELPEHPSMSIEEKVKLWSSASRFCVMIDRLPAGHLVEYPYLKSTRVVLILLRPEAGGSTTMIEDDSIDFPFIKMFRFEKSPLEVVDNALIWAEEFIEERTKAKGKV